MRTAVCLPPPGELEYGTHRAEDPARRFNRSGRACAYVHLGSKLYHAWQHFIHYFFICKVFS